MLCRGKPGGDPQALSVACYRCVTCGGRRGQNLPQFHMIGAHTCGQIICWLSPGCVLSAVGSARKRQHARQFRRRVRRVDVPPSLHAS